MTSDLQTALTILEERHAVDADELSNHIRDNFSGSLMSLKQLEPLVAEILRRFKHLPRKQKVDGTYPNISGCRTFKLWCREVLRRNDRTVRYMLAGGNKNRKDDAKGERVSTLDAVGILHYLDNHVGDLDSVQQKILAKGLDALAQRIRTSLERKSKKGESKWRAEESS